MVHRPPLRHDRLPDGAARSPRHARILPMRLSLERKFGWIHVRGGRVLRVATAHAVSTDTFHQEAAQAERLIGSDRGGQARDRFVGQKYVFCAERDLAVEVVNVKTGKVMGWSYLTGAAANLI